MSAETEAAEQEQDQKQQDEQQQQPVISQHTITISFPSTDVKQIQVQASSLETVNDIKQSLSDLVFTNQFTCFHLQYDGKILNDFVELGTLEGLPEAPEFQFIEAPYTERESRMHVSRIIDFLGGSMTTGTGGETNFGHLQINEAIPTPSANGGIDARASVDILTTHDVSEVPKCLKSLALSLWNPAPNHLKTRGHLLYLVLNSLEGDSIHITSTVSGFYANCSTAAKFDVAHRSGTKLYHSLLPLLMALSPLFKKIYAELEKYMTSRDPILTVPVVGAHTARPWMIAETEHLPDPIRIQRAYLEQGLENNDSLRDWNEELQTTRELPVSPLPERVLRSRLLQKTLYDFSAAAAKGAELVVKGELVSLNPTEEKDAQMYIYSNIFFSRGLDGVGTFLRDGGDAAAHKAVALDVNGVRILSTLDVDGLSTLGTCVVDYAGERIVAQSIVPGIFRQRAEDESQIIYGGVDGRDIVATDAKCNELFSKVSSALRLRRHPVYEKSGDVRKELELSIETKGLAGADGRTYVLDLYRITPVDIEFLEAECAGPNESEFVSVQQSHKDEAARIGEEYPHRLTVLRYELLEAYWEHKLNEYVQAKVADEDAQALRIENDTKALEDQKTPIDNEANKIIQNGETQEPNTGAISDSLATVEESNGKVPVNAMDKIDGTTESGSKARRIEISGFKLLFNPDAFHARVPVDVTEDDANQIKTDELLVRDVSKFLRETTIPRFVQDLIEARAATPIDSASLSKALHKRGINIRYLGRILKEAESDKSSAKHPAIITVIKRDIVLRSIKHVLSRILRGLPFPLVTSAVAHFLNCFFDSEPKPSSVAAELESLYPDHLSFKHLTQSDVKGRIEVEGMKRFRYKLENEWQSEARGLPLLREICLAFGLQLLARDFFAPLAKVEEVYVDSTLQHDTAKSKKNRKSKKENLSPSPAKTRTTMFTPEDILGILPVIKDSTPRSGLAEEAMEAGRISIVEDQKDLGMELLLESLSLHEQIYGVLHPEAARGYNALALIYSSLDDKANAAELAKKAVIVAERTLGLDNSETILYYLNLGLFEHTNGNTKQAVNYLQHALALWRVIFGANHPDMITTINNVAVMLQTQKMFPESLEWFQWSIDIAESFYGNTDVHVATLYFQVAQALALTGDHTSAIKRMRDAHEIFKKELGEDNENTKETHKWLSSMTQHAVHVARTAKIDATKQGNRIGATPALASRLQARTKLQNQATPDSAKPDTLIGIKGTQSIEELVKFVGDTNLPTAQSKKKGNNNKKR